MKRWVAFFSMTGSEIYNVSRRLRKTPDIVVTNKSSLEGVCQELLDKIKPDGLIIIPDRPSVEEYETVFRETLDTHGNILVTLHGFLRIVPPAICEKYEIINCHPGLITTYPELKGKDPQERACTYPTIGTVLHRVTAGVDEGPVLTSASCDNIYRNAETITHVLKHLSEDLWVDLLRKQYNFGL